jgi:hypothetical protein
MSKTVKIILIITVSVILLCACISTIVMVTSFASFRSVTSWSHNNNPVNDEVAVRVGEDIADFEVPTGFGNPYSVHFMDISLLGYSSESGRFHLFMAQLPEGTSIDLIKMLKMVADSSSDPNTIWFNTDTVLVSQETISIHGQESTLLISEGMSVDGTTFRTATAEFQGRSGPAIVMAAAPLEEWDIDTVETFIHSIR